MKKAVINIAILGTLALTMGACSNTAQVVGNLNCPTLEKGLSPSVGILSDENQNPTIVGNLPVGTVVRVYDYRNHAIHPRPLVRIKTEKTEGWVSPACLVVNQNPELSVFKWGYRKDYKYFYEPEDLDHYPKGYEYEEYKHLPKEKIPLAELAPELKEKKN